MNTSNITKIRVKLKAFNHELLVSSSQKIINILNKESLISLQLVTLPTSKRIYCVLRSPHVDKKSREHFEIRTHKRTLDISFNSEIPILNLLAKIDLAPGIFYRICLF